MKKAAVLSLTAFYLLLTTGMYVCLMHCSAEYLKAGSVTHMASMDASSHSQKTCTKDKNCDCCKNHGSYVVKENLKPASDFRFSKTELAITKTELPVLSLRAPDFSNTVTRTNDHAPPWKSGRIILTDICSLKI